MFEIGSTLREARVRRGLTLQQAEEDTKIRVRYLQAMENEEWDVLPGVAYAKGFLRTYATYLGLDPEVIVGEYKAQVLAEGERPPEPFAGSSLLGRPPAHRRRNTLLFVAVVCLLILAVLYLLGMGAGGEGGTPLTRPSALGIVTPTPLPSTTAPAPSPSVKPGLRGVVAVEAVDGDCWLQVRRDGPDGVVLFSGTLHQGDREAFKGKVLWLRLGFPAAVRLTVEGRRAPRLDLVEPVDLLVRGGRVIRQP